MGSRKSRLVVVLTTLFVLCSFSYAQQIVIAPGLDGSEYELAVPANWNGTLVVYAHGIVDPQLPVALPDIDTLKIPLLAAGFAVAYSSFSSNGYAVQDGMERTHELNAQFAAQFGKPKRTILMGHSLGGLIVLALAEKYPKEYDGALPMCGVVGGSIPEVNYVANGRMLYDLFFSSGVFGTFPYDLPGNGGNPVVLPFSSLSDPAYVGVLTNFTDGFAAPNYITQQYAETVPLPVNWADPQEVTTAAMTLVGFDIRYGSDLLARTHNRVPFTNVITFYNDPLAMKLDWLINADVERYIAPPQALDYLSENYSPTGRLKIPMLTVHTTRDPVVPIWHEDIYNTLTKWNHSSNLLVQTRIDRYGHCTFTDQETLDAFQKLILWVEAGVKPAP